MRTGARRSRRRVLAAGVAASMAVAVFPALGAVSGSGDAGAYPGSRDATLGPLVSGTAAYVNGTSVWTDYAYDDKGPNADALPGGDSAYPAGAKPGNAADIVQLQIGKTSDGDLDVRAVLETLVHPELALVGVGFDTDMSTSTGAAGVPGGRWATRSPLGLERFLVISATTTRVLAWNGGAWSEVASASTNVDQAANLVGAVIPRTALDAGPATWRAVGVAGLATPGSSWLDGSGPIYDLAFVHAEDPNTEAVYKVVDAGNQVKGQVTAGQGTSTEWQDKRQSDILAGKIDPSSAVEPIDFAKVDGHVTAIDPADEPGWHTFLYYSPLNYGEGIQTAPSSLGGSTRFAGPYQPYGVKLPSAGVLAQPSVPLLFFMHGANENHLQNDIAFEQSFSADIASPSHFDPPAIVAFGLGRDPDWETGPAEQDMLDVLADVSRRFPVDADRVFVSGISAGGAGTFHMAELHPDLFAGAFSLVGYDSTGLPGNLVNTPIRMQNGLADPLVNPALWLPTVQALDGRGDVDYRSFQNANRSHTHVPALGNCIYLEFIRRGRVVDPPRVAYTVDPAYEVDDTTSGLQIQHTGAYWVSGLARRDKAAAGSVDVPSLARGDRSPKATAVDTVHNNVVEGGRDYCGPNPDVVTGDTWHEHSTVVGPGAPQAQSNGATASLSNMGAATLDLGRMSLSTSGPLSFAVKGDGPASLRLTGPWSGPVSITRDGVPQGTVTPSNGAVTLTDDFAGAHTYVLTPTGS